jgi:hypothetical protein
MAPSSTIIFSLVPSPIIPTVAFLIPFHPLTFRLFHFAPKPGKYYPLSSFILFL